MTDEGFALRISPNKYLSEQESELHSILAVSRAGAGTGTAAGRSRRVGPQIAEVILVDCSGSMDCPSTKIAAARQATAAAIDVLRDGTLFAVVAGDSTARMVYPRQRRLAVAGPDTRIEAGRKADRLIAGGGTAIGRWLTLAGELLDPHPDAIRHVTLLTDGQNNEDPAVLEQVLAACRERFGCDARGIGDDWSVPELIRIASALRGTADAVPDERDLPEHFRAIINRALSKSIAELRLRIAMSPGVELRHVKQLFPTVSDLDEHVHRLDERTVAVDTGAWGEEDREYQLCLGVGQVGELREDVRVARIDLLVHGERQGAPVPVIVHRTDDPALSLPDDHSIPDDYRVQADLSQAMNVGCDAWEVGDQHAAQESWGRAVRLAAEIRHQEALDRLGVVVHIDDATAGKVRLRSDLLPRHVKSLQLGSLISRSSRDAGSADLPVTGPDKVCRCGWISPPDADFCEECDSVLDGSGGSGRRP